MSRFTKYYIFANLPATNIPIYQMCVCVCVCVYVRTYLTYARTDA